MMSRDVCLFNHLKPTLKVWLYSQSSDPTLTTHQCCRVLCTARPLDATAQGETSSLQLSTTT